MKRRDFLKIIGWGAASAAMPGCMRTTKLSTKASAKRANILLAISDDQSWPHAGAYGCRFVNTPAFDRISREGILFTHGYAPAPSCSPARASLLTGRNIWQNQEAGVHGSLFPKKFKVFPHLLQQAGYHVGSTGKLWGPGKEEKGRGHSLCGKKYNKRRGKPPAQRMNRNDYAANFADFLEERSENQPFFFWFGCTEPHRPYQAGFALQAGKKLTDVDVPTFIPDNETIRSDILDYGFEIDWFDTHLGRMIKMLEDTGELDNTIIVATSDNGMPFARAKMQIYEFGTHVPLAIRWGDKIKPGRVVDDFVSFIDFGPTFLDAAGLTLPSQMSGRSLMNVFVSPKSGRVDPKRSRVFTGKERHSCARPYNMCYPIRAIRTDKYLYLRNFKPDRWPAGDPPYFLDMYWWLKYDNPTGRYIIEHKDNEEIRRFFELNTAKRPAEELYAVEEDPGCIRNLAADPKFAQVKKKLWAELKQHLTKQKDPRVLGKGDFFDSVPMFFKHNFHPETGEPLFDGVVPRGQYNPKFSKDAEKKNQWLRQMFGETDSEKSK